MIGVVGLGFVGLTTALGFCEKSEYKVYGCDKNPERYELIKSGNVPFYEPGLGEALTKYLNKQFELITNLDDMIDKCDVIFYCVGTPANEDGSADLSILESAIKDTFRRYNKNGYKVVVIKSTVPPGITSGPILDIIKSLNLENIGLANNPEFLREGYSWDDFINPDRIVIGQLNEKSGAIVENLYVRFNAPICRVNLNTGEYIKYVSNTLLATLISYSNEMSIIADYIGDINIKSAFNILHMDKRWFGDPAKMATYAYPGCGYGGYCLPKDTQALYNQSNKYGFNPKIIKNVIETNENIKLHVIERIKKIISTESKLGILGLSFKPGSDDVRDTPAKYIIDGLLNAGYKNITAHDPIAINEFSKYHDYDIQYTSDLSTILNSCDAFVLVTGWPEYIDKSNIIKSKPFVDTRYILP